MEQSSGGMSEKSKKIKNSLEFYFFYAICILGLVRMTLVHRVAGNFPAFFSEAVYVRKDFKCFY